MTVQRIRDGERRMAEALAPFGWTCTDEFWSRYYSDPWVFNLVNANVALTEENVRLRAQIAKESEPEADIARTTT